MSYLRRATAVLFSIGITSSTIVACSGAQSPKDAESGESSPSKERALEFVKKLDRELRALWTESARAEWIKSTYITGDTESLAAETNEKLLAYNAKAIKTAASFKDLELPADAARQLHLLRVSSSLPPPSDPAQQKELAELMAKMEGLYGKGKYCRGEVCRDLGQLSEVLTKSRDEAELYDAWAGWHTVSPPMKPLYSRFVEIANSGAKEIGFQNVGELWRSGYDMTPEALEAETDRLWTELKPLYDQLHCYVRGKLSTKYGAVNVPKNGLIPAHLLGNMWAQEWGNIYDLVEPYPGQASLDVSKALVAKKMQPVQMVKLGESFFTSLGLKVLPESFWTNSMFVQPRDRDVVCHASAWDMNYGRGDVRIKMCIKINEEDLITIHHELGHIYYYLYYNDLPTLFQAGANDGFHEAIGDALALSVTPSYLAKIGILKDAPKNEKALINIQLKDALDKIAFLPFGRLMDQWRWDVFSGKVTPEHYNEAWWALRAKFQGIGPKSPRDETLFDPGAKYHIPANVPYLRYFFARVLQFQFHEAMCKAAGHTGPLHECSIFQNQAAGERLAAMLELGASKPWREALFAMTGSHEMSAQPLRTYFAPLAAWLEKQNAGQTCGF